MNQISNLSSKKSNSLSASFMETSLPEKIAQCWLRQNDTQYQQMLIEQKQLQLILFQQQTKSKALLKNFSRKKGEVDKLQEEFNITNKELLQKKIYLNNYYQHLNDRLRTDASSISLIAKLQNLSTQLNAKLDNQKAYLQSFLHNLKDQILKLEEEQTFLQNKRENLKGNLVNLKQAKQTFKNEQQKKREIQKNRRIQLKQEYQQQQAQFKMQLQQKKQMENNENILKKLLNVEQIHKKYWLLLEKAIKNEFTNKAIEKMKKEKVNQEYKAKIQEKRQEIARKRNELESLTSQLEGIGKKKNSMKNILAQSTQRFQQIQKQLLAATQPR